MTPILAIQDLSIILAAKNHQSTLLTPDFLKYSGIVPTNWELARAPIATPQMSHVSFQNGINFVAQPGSIVFSESLGNKNLEDVQIHAIARKYVETLPNADYQGVGINPGSFITFNDNNKDVARNYIVTTILSSGAWLEVGQEPPKASINIVYTLEQRQLNLNIAETKLQLPERPPQFAVLFSGNFTYKITANTPSEKLKQLCQLIDYWQRDLEVYQDIVKNKFLGQLEGTL